VKWDRQIMMGQKGVNVKRLCFSFAAKHSVRILSGYMLMKRYKVRYIFKGAFMDERRTGGVMLWLALGAKS
jgi:hypothetical protein